MSYLASEPQLDIQAIAKRAMHKDPPSAAQGLRKFIPTTSVLTEERKALMGTPLNRKMQKPLGFFLVCAALAVFVLIYLDATPFKSLMLSAGLSSTFFGILFLLEDKLMFGFRERLAIFGWGFFIGAFIRNILFY